MAEERKKILIFDFDGTIADSENIIYEVINEVLASEGIEPIDEKLLIRMRNSPSREILKDFNVAWWKLPFLVRKAKKMLGSRITSVAPIEKMDSILEQLKKKGHCLILLTSNSKANASFFINKHHLEFFDHLYCDIGLFGKSRFFKKIVKKYRDVYQDIYSIADETRDIEAAKKAGIKSIAVTWGLCSRSILKKFLPDYVVDKPEDILKIIQ